MTGHETVIVTMLTPKGVSLVQALTFNQAGGVYGADITSLEVQCLLPDVPVSCSVLDALHSWPAMLSGIVYVIEYGMLAKVTAFPLVDL